MSEASVRDAGVFDPKQVTQLWRKCQARSAEGQFSNTDNMAVVAVLSTQLLHETLVRSVPEVPVRALRTLVDRVSEVASPGR